VAAKNEAIKLVCVCVFLFHVDNKGVIEVTTDTTNCYDRLRENVTGIF